MTKFSFFLLLAAHLAAVYCQPHACFEPFYRNVVHLKQVEKENCASLIQPTKDALGAVGAHCVGDYGVIDDPACGAASEPSHKCVSIAHAFTNQAGDFDYDAFIREVKIIFKYYPECNWDSALALLHECGTNVQFYNFCGKLECVLKKLKALSS